MNKEKMHNYYLLLVIVIQAPSCVEPLCLFSLLKCVNCVSLYNCLKFERVIKPLSCVNILFE